jgi:hypothetical protein
MTDADRWQTTMFAAGHSIGQFAGFDQLTYTGVSLAL